MSNFRITVTSIKDVVTGLVAIGLTPKSLPLLHALTGCDTNSFLFGVTKKNSMFNIYDIS